MLDKALDNVVKTFIYHGIDIAEVLAQAYGADLGTFMSLVPNDKAKYYKGGDASDMVRTSQTNVHD